MIDYLQRVPFSALVLGISLVLAILETWETRRRWHSLKLWERASGVITATGLFLVAVFTSFGSRHGNLSVKFMRPRAQGGTLALAKTSERQAEDSGHGFIVCQKPLCARVRLPRILFVSLIQRRTCGGAAYSSSNSRTG